MQPGNLKNRNEDKFVPGCDQFLKRALLNRAISLRTCRTVRIVLLLIRIAFQPLEVFLFQRLCVFSATEVESRFDFIGRRIPTTSHRVSELTW